MTVGTAHSFQPARQMTGSAASSAPVVIGGQGEHADDAADPVICLAGWKECAVPTVMLDHEQPHQESRSRKRKNYIDPEQPKLQAGPHQHPKQEQRYRCDQDLDHAASGIRTSIGRKLQGEFASIKDADA